MNIHDVSLLYPQKGFRKVLGLKINQVPRNSISAILRALKKSDIVVGGGGGIFQDESSWKSFFYYDWLVSTALWMKKPVYLLGHGIGDIRSSFHYRRMRKILSNPLCVGYFRDDISYRYAKHFSDFHKRGSDLAYGFLLNRERKKSNPRKIGLLLKNPVQDAESFIKPFKEEGFESIELLASFPFEEMKIVTQLEKTFSKDFDVHIRQYEGGQMLDYISDCSLLITERLHGAIVASFFGVPFLCKDSFKIKTYLRGFKAYKSFYKEFNRMEIWAAISELRSIDFDRSNHAFLQENIEIYHRMVDSFSRIFKKN